jgi:hypothetical protein
VGGEGWSRGIGGGWRQYVGHSRQVICVHRPRGGLKGGVAGGQQDAGGVLAELRGVVYAFLFGNSLTM